MPKVGRRTKNAQAIRQAFRNYWTDLKIKNKALDMLNDTTAALEEFSPILYYGNLLGCCRDGKQVPWDGDFDLCINMADKDKIKPILDNLSKQYSILYPPDNDPTYFRVCLPEKYGGEYMPKLGFNWPFVDILFYSIRNYVVEFYWGGVGQVNGEYPVYYRSLTEDLFPLEKKMFEGMMFNVPKNAEYHLDKMYPGWREFYVNHKDFKAGKILAQTIFYKIPIKELEKIINE